MGATPDREQLALHGDAPRRQQLVMRLKDAVRRWRVSGQPAPAVDGPYLIVPILGQSNAAGDNAIRPEDAEPSALPVHQWPGCGRRRGQILLATDPLLHEIPAAGVGFGRTFGERLAEDTGRPVLLVPCARGDTSFHPKNGYSWSTSDRSARVNLFDFAVGQILSAMQAAGPSAEVAAVLWHQGESDVPLLAPDEYRRQLTSLIDGIRSRCVSTNSSDSSAAVPFIVGQMVPEEITHGHPGYPGIDAVHRALPDTVEGVAFVPGPRNMNGDPIIIHYSREGQIELGERIFTAYRSLTTPGQ